MKSDEYLSIRIKTPDPISKVNLMITGAGFKMEAHTHSFYHVNRIMDGSVTLGIDGKNYELDAGYIMILPPGRPHSLYSHSGYKQIGVDVECICDSRGFFSEIESITGGFCAKKLPLTAYAASEEIAQMRSILTNPTRGNIMRAVNTAERQIIDLLESLREESSNSFVEQFSVMLSEHKPWELSLSDMCRILCISRTQLERKSKLAFGCGASEYCARLRYSMVCNFLKSNMTLEGIAEQAGFYDACHLSRFFTARAGMTPGQYRASI